MAQIIKVDGTIITIEPKNGDDFKLEELQAIVGGFIEICQLPNNQILVIDEEGKIKEKELNRVATIAFQLSKRRDWIAGDALLCSINQVK